MDKLLKVRQYFFLNCPDCIESRILSTASYLRLSIIGHCPTIGHSLLTDFGQAKVEVRGFHANLPLPLSLSLFFLSPYPLTFYHCCVKEALIISPVPFGNV